MSTGTPERADHCGKSLAESIPKTATATAMANSKLFEAAVKLKWRLLISGACLHGKVEGGENMITNKAKAESPHAPHPWATEQCIRL